MYRYLQKNMQARHSGVQVGKDENGIYLIIQFSKDMIDKVYVDEFFEECIDQGTKIDININPTVKPRSRPEAFYDFLDQGEIARVRKALDLREDYIPVRDDLNSFIYLKNYLDQHPPALKYIAKNREEHATWASEVIKKITDITGYEKIGQRELEIEEGPQTELEGIILKKVYITTAPGLKAPAILAKPKQMEIPMPGIICVHGHNKGKINTIGMLESSSNSYYGIELAKRGYVTLSLDQWGWGERKGFNYKHEGKPEEVFAKSALLLGTTAIGIRSWDVSRSIDYLETLDFVNSKFGVIGQSGGGTTAAFSSVLEDRIDASIVSGYFCTWEKSIFAMKHCSCNFVPNILNHVEMHDLMAARAPKPTFIVSGDSDPIFPQSGVQDAYKKLKKAYDLYDKPENLGIDVIPNTGHVFRGKHAYPWLDKMLLDD